MRKVLGKRRLHAGGSLCFEGGILANSILATRTSSRDSQQLHILARAGFIDFVSRGNYLCDPRRIAWAWFLNSYNVRQTSLDRRVVLYVARRMPALWRARHDPYQSEELTTIIEQEAKEFVVSGRLKRRNTSGFRELVRFHRREGA